MLPGKVLQKATDEPRLLYNPGICPHCKKDTMVTMERFTGQGHPVWTKVKV